MIGVETMKILVPEKIEREGLANLEKKFKIDYKEEMKEEELKRIIGEYDGIIIRSKTKLTKEVLENGKKLKVIGRAGVGVDNVDIPYATQKGIFVINAPTGNIVSAAEHTIATMLSLLRKIPKADGLCKQGTWNRKLMGREVRGKTIGIVGLGKIGTLVAQRLAPFGCRLIAFDPFVSDEKMKGMGIEKMELDELFRQADIITLHTALTEQTKNMISDKQLGIMKDGIYIVNCSRGAVIDEKALLKALKEGKVAGAALDVFSKEPPEEGSAAWEIMKHENVVATPHLGGNTEDAQLFVAKDVAEQVEKALAGEPCYALNMPFMIDPTKLKELQKYLEMAEMLGKIIIQLHPEAIREVEVRVFGTKEIKPLAIAALKGVLSPIVNDVSYVNALIFAEQRGIKVKETEVSGGSAYSNLIEVLIKTEKEKHRIAGTLFYEKQPRIINLDGYSLEMKPEKIMLVLESRDMPGVIGKVGTLLGNNKVNIAEFTLARDSPGGMALSIVSTDNDIPEKVMGELRGFEEMVRASVVKL